MVFISILNVIILLCILIFFFTLIYVGKFGGRRESLLLKLFMSFYCPKYDAVIFLTFSYLRTLLIFIGCRNLCLICADKQYLLHTLYAYSYTYVFAVCVVMPRVFLFPICSTRLQLLNMLLTKVSVLYIPFKLCTDCRLSM